MFTGIVQGVAAVRAIADRSGLRTLRLGLPPGFGSGLEVGASVSVDGVCLTAAALHRDPSGGDDIVAADFDVMQQTLALTTLSGLAEGALINVERAARDGAEIGGHPLSGHIDVSGRIVEVRQPENNHVLRIAVPAPWMRYVFAKGYIAVNGASLTVAEIRRESDASGWFEIWLIPETLRQTTFASKAVGASVNIEIERQTQVFVDTVRAAVDERLSTLLPGLQALLAQHGLGLEGLASLPLAPPGQPLDQPPETSAGV
jgi:riboflavin synthase